MRHDGFSTTSKTSIMNTHDALKLSINMGEFVGLGYLDDLTDAEMLHRPSPESNHIKWQLGHLIHSEYELNNVAVPGAAPPLPEGFAERYSRDKTKLDDPDAFDSKADLLILHRQQRDATLAMLETLKEDDFDRATGIDYAPTVGAIFSMHGAHWLMHAGQWAVIRRQLGRPPQF